MTPFFSVVVSLYNVERFFKSGWECLAKQSFNDFEIILVDDGSEDSTHEICDRVAETEKNVKIIHQENKGLGGARNTGIEAANGKYICFFDIDDEVENSWLQNIYEEIKEIEPDLLVYGYQEVNKKYSSLNSFSFERKLLDDRTALAKEFVDSLSGIRFNNGFAWNKVYSRKFILDNDLRFSNDAIQQDEIFNHRVYEAYPLILISDKLLYRYNIYHQGNNRKRYIRERIDNFENVKKSFVSIKNKFEIEDKRFEYYYHSRFIKNVLFNRNPMPTFKERKDYFLRITDNSQVIESIYYLRENKIKSRNVNEMVFNIYCYGIRRKSLPILVFADLLNGCCRSLSELFHRWGSIK